MYLEACSIAWCALRPGPKASYAERQALYPVPVRHNKCPPTASFRFTATRDTLAFGFKIPAITALLGLGGFIPRTHEIHYMPGTLQINPLWGKYMNSNQKSNNAYI
jgi:hypothetical protein